ncbi:MAG: CPBP family intramembrane metalloprotease [Chloroflexota bacterium]|nr:CPBP family intramembrane metalloprotease [Chloroflexota bacterium]
MPPGRRLDRWLTQGALTLILSHCGGRGTIDRASDATDKGGSNVRGAPTALALAAAYAAFGLTFRGPRDRFWQRMTGTGLTLGALALTADRNRYRYERPAGRSLLLGLASAAGLYGAFRLGDKLARRLMPRGSQEIGDIYALGSLRPRPELALRLATIVAPAEELFWRGFLQRRLQARFGRWRGAAAATAAYGGAHLITGNATLVGAATVAGAYWCALAAAGFPMSALIASHVAWDVWIFLVAPTEKAAPPARLR